MPTELDDNYADGSHANTSTAGAGTSTGAGNGTIDVTGGALSIQANRLLAASGSDGGVRLAMRPSAEFHVAQGSEIILRRDELSSLNAVPAVVITNRNSAAYQNLSAYTAELDMSTGTTAFLNIYRDGAYNIASNSTPLTNIPTGVDLKLRLARSRVNASDLVATLTRTDTSVILLTTTVSSSLQTLQVAGAAGFYVRAANGTAQSAQIKRFTTDYAATPDPLVIHDPVQTNTPDDATITVEAADSGGTGAVTATLHRATVPEFTAGGGNEVASGTPPFAYTDTALSPGEVSYFKAVYTDSAGSPQVVPTEVRAATREIDLTVNVRNNQHRDSRVGIISNSIYTGDIVGDPTHDTILAAAAVVSGKLTGTVNWANGAQPTTYTTQWLPDAAPIVTFDPTLTYNLLQLARNKCIAAGKVTHLYFSHGINDVSQGLSQSAFRANAEEILLFCLQDADWADAFDQDEGLIILNPATYVHIAQSNNVFSDASLTRLLQYNAILPTIAATLNSAAGRTAAVVSTEPFFALFVDDPERSIDGTHPQGPSVGHPNAHGFEALGTLIGRDWLIRTTPEISGKPNFGSVFVGSRFIPTGAGGRL